ncbi:MAG: GNAT family N-acetyltransferase [Rikenellaceae bacterium]|nr:GNAT family N-acetyltransferase [Rikenellaceae bacterium]
MDDKRFGAVRPAPVESYPALAAIWERSVAATHRFLSASHFEQLKAQLPCWFPEMDHLYMFEGAGGRPLGFIGVRDGKIEMLFADPGHMGKGIGSTLFDYGVEILGAARVDVNEQNTGACTFYIRKGCRVVSRSPFDPSGMPYPILHLAIRQGHPAE